MRLTGKNETGYYSLDGDLSGDKPSANKLGELEDLLEKYGIENLVDLNVVLAEYFANVKEHSFKGK